MTIQDRGRRRRSGVGGEAGERTERKGRSEAGEGSRELGGRGGGLSCWSGG